MLQKKTDKTDLQLNEDKSMAEKNITVTLQTKELKYEIENKTHVTARSLQASGKLGYEAAAHIQATTDPESAYETNHAISTAIAETRVELAEYLIADTTATNNLIRQDVDEGKPVVLTFILPGNYNPTAADAIAYSIHEYIVQRALYEWYRQTCPEIADTSRIDAETALQQAKKALYKRSRPDRPTYN